MRKYLCGFVLMLITFLFLLRMPVEAATLKLNKTKVAIQYGNTYQLKANQKVTWTSSNNKIVTVSSSGKIKGVGFGSAKIIAKNKKGKTKTCNVIVQNYYITKTNKKEYPNIITIYTNGKPKTYTVYNQKGYSDSWIKNRGCSASAVAIITSAYGQKQTPKDIHYGTVDKQYSERYALKKLKKNVAINNNKSLTFYFLNQILNNSGVKSHAVYKYNKSKAIKEITANLKNGKPVIIICHNKKVNGNRLATYIHFLVLAGIDSNGKAIVLDPNGGGVNKSPHTGAFSLTVSQIVNRHMFSCTGNDYLQLYYKKTKNMGGYILIDE